MATTWLAAALLIVVVLVQRRWIGILERYTARQSAVSVALLAAAERLLAETWPHVRWGLAEQQVSRVFLVNLERGYARFMVALEEAVTEQRGTADGLIGEAAAELAAQRAIDEALSDAE